jgi:hypothetical protein
MASKPSIQFRTKHPVRCRYVTWEKPRENEDEKTKQIKKSYDIVLMIPKNCPKGVEVYNQINDAIQQVGDKAYNANGNNPNWRQNAGLKIAEAFDWDVQKKFRDNKDPSQGYKNPEYEGHWVFSFSKPVYDDKPPIMTVVDWNKQYLKDPKTGACLREGALANGDHVIIMAEAREYEYMEKNVIVNQGISLRLNGIQLVKVSDERFVYNDCDADDFDEIENPDENGFDSVPSPAPAPIGVALPPTFGPPPVAPAPYPVAPPPGGVPF